MDFEQTFQQFASTVGDVKGCCRTEESTKHSLILPVIQMLGYDIFNPTEVVPEVDCDIRQGGEKVDYVIQRNGQHLILIECKHWTKNLDNYEAQLRSYFVASKARFGILTNGIEYRFFTDLENPNLMDDVPFLVVDIEDTSKEGLEGLKMFCRDTFNEQMIIERARELKCMSAIREAVGQELANPSIGLVTHFAKLIYGQVPSRSIREQMQPLLARAFNEYIHGESDAVGSQLVAGGSSDILSVVQDILTGVVSRDRVQQFDGAGYSSIRLDGSQWWPIIKFKFTEYAKWVAIGRYWSSTSHFYCNQKDREYITSAEDIMGFSKDIRDIVNVMLIDGENQDELRAQWVAMNRPDWNE